MNIIVEVDDHYIRGSYENMIKFFAVELGVYNLNETVCMRLISGLRPQCAGFTIKKHGVIFVGIDADLNIPDAVVTLAHEMVHVGQIARGELKVEHEDDEPVPYWKGNPTKVAYKNQPWEIEANAQEVLLTKKLLKKLGLIKE